ncbi:MAG: hypothetical protein DMG31_08725 [Acidobacteria bacterium]|nr:MAG: hypothetical protein DMG31_08725 [Acidobacteriota bacterium]
MTLLIHRLRRTLLFCTAGLACSFFGLALPAQQLEQRPPERQHPEAPSQSESPDTSAPKFDPETGGSNDRLFWTLPNFLALENAHNIPPLTSGQKFKLVARGTFDPVEFPFFAFLAGISQADNSESGYGQGAAGFGKRFGSNFADGTSENFFVQAIFPSLFRQDPRYYQEGRGGFWRRAGYAVTRTAVTRSDTGHMVFNISEVAGAGMAAAISNTYHPASDRTLPNTVQTWASMMGWDTVSNVVKEFWPDIRRKVHQRKE